MCTKADLLCASDLGHTASSSYVLLGLKASFGDYDLEDLCKDRGILFSGRLMNESEPGWDVKPRERSWSSASRV